MSLTFRWRFWRFGYAWGDYHVFGWRRIAWRLWIRTWAVKERSL